MTSDLNQLGPATRQQGLERLESFVPRAGHIYAAERNYDYGPHERANVSMLSPWLSHRLLLEEEAIRAVLAQHGPSAPRKFIQEICWRSYWKGWLEMRPKVWRDYQAGVAAAYDAINTNDSRRKKLVRALNGATGIECFDFWVSELAESGYLHNHARMWFASIWIFTLGLPWQLGADLFMRMLVDADPASNTLSWRWVAGLQTKGKYYLADADNIARYTGGRFPSTPGLQAEPQESVMPKLKRYSPMSLRPPEKPNSHPFVLLLPMEDLGLEFALLEQAEIKGVAAFNATQGRSPQPVSEVAQNFTQAALEDGLKRASQELGVEAYRFEKTPGPGELTAWCRDHGCEQILMPYCPVGPSRDLVDGIETNLALEGIQIVRIQRPWDTTVWPYATKGFFHFQRQIQPILDGLDTTPRIAIS